MLCDNHQPYRKLGAVFLPLLQDSNPELAITALINYRLLCPFGCTIFLLITTHFARWEIGIGRLHCKKVWGNPVSSTGPELGLVDLVDLVLIKTTFLS